MTEQLRFPAATLFAGAALVFLIACQAGGEPGDTADSDTAAGKAATDETALSDSPAADGTAASDSGGFVLKDVGFQTPESVLHDEAADVYLVSNINGGPADKDHNGFISRVSPQGELIELKWIDGRGAEGEGDDQGSDDRGGDVTLHAPKGMAIHADTLFVADIDTVRMFDRGTGRPLGARAVPGATFLNDMATGPDGTVYVTDTGVRAGAAGLEPAGADALYRFDAEAGAVAVVKGAQLGGPNGVAVDEAGPVLVTFGSGKILRVKEDGALEELAAPPTGQLDGVVLLGPGGMIVTSWEGKSVYHITTGGEVHEVWTDIESPADLGFDHGRSRMLVPSFTGNFVEVRPTR